MMGREHRDQGRRSCRLRKDLGQRMIFRGRIVRLWREMVSLWKFRGCESWYSFGTQHTSTGDVLLRRDFLPIDLHA